MDIAHAGLGDVIGDVTGQVEETTEAVEEQADELTDAADETVADAKEKVDETVEQVTETADQAVGAVSRIVEGTPAGGVLEDAKASVDPVVGTVGAGRRVRQWHPACRFPARRQGHRRGRTWKLSSDGAEDESGSGLRGSERRAEHHEFTTLQRAYEP